MRVAVAISIAALFLLAFASGEIYLPAAAVGVLALVCAALFLNAHGSFTRKNVVLALWLILISHRAFIFRGSLAESGSLYFVEIGVTMAVLLGAMVTFATSISSLQIRAFESKFWLLAYVLLAGASLLWTPSATYAGFWILRLSCAAILIVVYFSDASIEDCSKFFTVTLLGTAPVILLPIFAYSSFETTAQSGAHRVAGTWVHPGVVSIAACSVAAACLTDLLQRKAGSNRRRFYLFAVLFVLSCASGFLAGGKTGAIGSAIAIGLMLLIGGHLRIWIGFLATAVIGYVVFDLVLRQLEVGLFAHMQGYNFERLGTLQSRLDLWIGALQSWSEFVLNAVFGRGFTSFRAAPLSSLGGWAPGHAHSSFVTLLVDMGIIGFFFFVMMLARPIVRSALIAIRQRRAFSESPAFPPFIALTSLMIGSLLDDVFGGTLQPTTYLLIGTVITLDRVLTLTWYDDATTATVSPSDLATNLPSRPY